MIEPLEWRQEPCADVILRAQQTILCSFVEYSRGVGAKARVLSLEQLKADEVRRRGALLSLRELILELCNLVECCLHFVVQSDEKDGTLFPTIEILLSSLLVYRRLSAAFPGGPDGGSEGQHLCVTAFQMHGVTDYADTRHDVNCIRAFVKAALITCNIREII